MRSRPEPILVEVGAGELIDKITILQIKAARIAEPAKLVNIQHELDLLLTVRNATVPNTTAIADAEAQLKAVNEQLWDIEDDLRHHEAAQDFGVRFVELARAVYHTNDRRAALKKTINLATGATVVEEKSYGSHP